MKLCNLRLLSISFPIVLIMLVFLVDLSIANAKPDHIDQTMTREQADFAGLTGKSMYVEQLEKLPQSELIALAQNAKTDDYLLKSIGDSLINRDPKESVQIIETVLPCLRHKYQYAYFLESYGRALAESTHPDDTGSTISALLKLHGERLGEWNESIGLEQYWAHIIGIAIERAAYKENLTPEQFNNLSEIQIQTDDSEYVVRMKKNIKFNYQNSINLWDREPLMKAADAAYPLQSEIDDPARVPAWLDSRTTDTAITEPERKRLIKFLQSGDRENFLKHKDKIADLLISDQLEDVYNHYYENAYQYYLAYNNLRIPDSATDIPAVLDQLTQSRVDLAVVYVGTHSRPYSHDEITLDKFLAAGLARTLQRTVEKFPQESVNWLNSTDMATLSNSQKLFLREGFYSGLSYSGQEAMKNQAAQYLNQQVTVPPNYHPRRKSTLE